MIFKIALTLFLIAMFFFISFGVKTGFNNKVRLLLRLGIVVLLGLIIVTYFVKKIF